MKLVDYGSESEESDEEAIVESKEKVSSPQKTQQKHQQTAENEENIKNEHDGEHTKKKIMLKYKDLPRFLNPTIHKQDNKDSWTPKSLAEIEQERKKRKIDLSDGNDQKLKLTKVMRLPSPKHEIQNETIQNFSFNKQKIQPVLPPSIDPDSLFQDEIVDEQSLIAQYDKEDIFISKRHQQITENHDEAQDLHKQKYAKNRIANEAEQEILDQDQKNSNGQIKISEISREQLIGDSNWLLNHQKQQQKNILRSGFQLNTQVDKTQKQKNQLNFLAVEAIENSDHLDQQRSEQIRNTQRKRERYGW